MCKDTGNNGHAEDSTPPVSPVEVNAVLVQREKETGGEGLGSGQTIPTGGDTAETRMLASPCFLGQGIL